MSRGYGRLAGVMAVVLLFLVVAAVSAAMRRSHHGQPAHSSKPASLALSVRLARERARLPIETLEELRTQLVLESRTASSSDHVLNTAASRIAGHAVEVGCARSTSDWQWHRSLAGNVQGYAQTAPDAVIAWLAPPACGGALAVAYGNEQYPAAGRALGVLVLTHESLHLRSNWSERLNEATVECGAIRLFNQSVIALGGTASEAKELWPWALAIHWRQARENGDYWKKNCHLDVPAL